MFAKPPLPIIAAAALCSAAALAQPPAPRTDTCRDCGTVQSVQRVTRTTQPKGIAGSPVTPGMAVGGVVGGLVGNQIGGGSGKGAATVLGAAGGAYLGHSIEKKQYTAYVMRIRMQDGSIRTVEQRTPIARGSHVIVQGHTARLQTTGSRAG